MIEVLHPGFFSSIQDQGRFKGLEYGIPISGAMDSLAANLANRLVGNSPVKAVIEATMTGPILKFNMDAAIAVCGADMIPKIDNEPILMNTKVQVKKGQTLSFGRLQAGFRTYIAVSGGFESEIKFGSRSYYAAITDKQVLGKNEIIKVLENRDDCFDKAFAKRIDLNYLSDKHLKAFKGPEYESMNQKQKTDLEKMEFSVSKYNNRMAYQLDGPIHNNLESIITSPVMPGTVQLTPSGKLIVLMRDCQTTGGYPRILQLSESAINSLAQKFTGQKLKFDVVDL